MAHEITIRADGSAEAAFAMKPAWHGLTVGRMRMNKTAIARCRLYIRREPTTDTEARQSSHKRDWVMYVKTALDWSVDPEDGLPRRCIVVATSNSAAKIEDYLKERFEILQFSGGPSFAELAQERLAEIWLAEMPGEDMPYGWRNWGWQGDRFSMRLALRELERHVKAEEPVLVWPVPRDG
jgi:hypothetical protein